MTDELGARGLWVCEAARVSPLAPIALPNRLADRVFVPHTRGWVCLHVQAALPLRQVGHSVHDGPSVETRLVLPQAVLEVSQDALRGIPWDHASTIRNNV